MNANSFRRSEKGLALIFVTITLPAIIGFSLLAIDGARVYNLHNDLQKAADAFAITAAAELDGGTDSKPRAVLAIQTLVDNFSRFSDAGPVVLDENSITWRFLAGIPGLAGLPGDDDWFEPGTLLVPFGAPYSSVTDTDARFIEVVVNPTTLNTVFPASFLGGSNVATLSASAVAGFTQGVCDFTPVYICNPYEDPGGGDTQSPTLFEAATQRDERRKLIYLRKQGGGGCQNGPGNYGFLEGQFGPGANALIEAIASANPPTCYSSEGVEPETGFIASTRFALGVRFDLYGGPMSSAKNNPDYRPARNVRKGYDPGASACNQSDVPPPDPPDITARQYMSLPRGGIANDSCATGKQGNGVWDFMKYMIVNHYGAPGLNYPNPVTDDTNNAAYYYIPDLANPGVRWDNSNLNRPTRYDVYRHEIDNSMVDGAGHMSGGQMVPSEANEDGAPVCGDLTELSDDPDRRLLYGAVLNCIEHADELVGGSGDPIPVVSFVSFFITEPVDDSGGNASIIVELVDISGQGGLGTLEAFARDNVQLYR